MMPPLPPDAPTPLARKLAARIAAAGPIPVHDYIEACLYDPEHGYYRERSAIGRGGDFVTAPEISQVFGELTGLWAGESWRLMGEPETLRLIELGPGRGTLMADALRALRVLPDLLARATIHLVESSLVLRQVQRKTLAAAPCPVLWHQSVEELPAGPSIVIANEFLDCLPVRQLVFDAAERAWRERMVGVKEGRFVLETGRSMDFPADPHPLPQGGQGEEDFDFEDGAIFETRPAIPHLLDAFAKRAAEAPFAGLFIDYGYAKPSFGDTVQAVRRHAFAGIFDAPGETDITAHVDFSSFCEEARALALNAFGPMPMGEWLLRLGLEARFLKLVQNLPEDKARDILGRIARLVDPSQMGVLFKTVLLTDSDMPALPPFV
jgi:NADH dehydrogenase [ubiquinone] 1 alpha subcomplex assembly factor 7